MPTHRLLTLLRKRSSIQWAPALVAFVATIALVLPHGVNLGQISAYVLATIWGVLIPGLIVTRLCRGQARSLLEELAVGFIVGLMVQLIAWALFVALDIGAFLALYPVPLIAVILGVPRLRVRLATDAYEERQPWWASWSLAAAYVVSVAMLARRMFAVNPLPPRQTRWYPDLYWHMAVAASARTSVPPLVPQVSGQTLKYHWFSNAHMAADSLISRVDVLVVGSRLWYLPIYASIMVLIYLLARRLSGRAVAGLISLVLVLTQASINPLRWVGAEGADPLVAYSPSEVMGVPMLVLTAWWLIEIVRGARPGRAGWVLLTLMMLTCAGSKSSNLPVLLCGLLLVGVVGLLSRRREKRIWVATGLCLGSIAITAPFLLGGSNVSKLMPLALHQSQLLTWFPNALEHTDVWRYTFLIALTVLALVQFAGVALIAPLWRDPAVVLLLGILVAGFSATLVVSHPSLSELYFLRGVMPLADVVIAWGLVRAIGRRSRGWWLSGAGVLAGGALIYAIRQLSDKKLPLADNAMRTVLITAAVALVVVGAGVAAWRLLGADGTRGTGRALLAGLLVGAAVIPSGVAVAQSAPNLAYVNSARNWLSPGAVPATTWLRTHTPENTLLATNVHCRSIPTQFICDSRALWVTALSERRAYVGSWGYTDQAYATANHPRPGEAGIFYWSASFYDQPRLKLNDAAFNGPTPYVLRTLYDRGVRYLIGDTSASPVSAKLATMAQEVFHSGKVSVYRLHKP